MSLFLPLSLLAAIVPAGDSNHVVPQARLEALRYRNVGPTRGGRSTAIAGIPGEPHSFLHGTAGGVWKTTNAGQSWLPISDRDFGTGSIGAIDILYIDEVFGYLPPLSNPPSKIPLLTLLKQARAFGLGIILATQNPVDLDYKAISNAGTWFLGRLQTERDKARVIDGLEGASLSGEQQFNRQNMEQLLSGLGNRVFLMNNVHDDPACREVRLTRIPDDQKLICVLPVRASNNSRCLQVSRSVCFAGSSTSLKPTSGSAVY